MYKYFKTSADDGDARPDDESGLLVFGNTLILARSNFFTRQTIGERRSLTRYISF